VKARRFLPQDEVFMSQRHLQ